ncbi:PREDICTED: uncharacterized protein LOC108368035 isoform X1 [Rhagoletis zephyria]|uniref:uncharacterized protein LOC108368035 isoform X1 n=1 Tax=Rhagoletis zephyria TaxID=28612 RepID=UPI0008119C3B|nr:PREDICTED: uncharacterized protein LOC108368035 isoform X1 [Rhagoletis zephyria]
MCEYLEKVEDTLVVGAVTCKVAIGNVTVFHKFIVADIVDEVIIGVDFLFDQGMQIDMTNRIMTYNNMEVPLSFGYDGPYISKRVILGESKQIPPKSETVVWVKIDGDCVTNKLWVVEATQNSTPDVLIGKTLGKSQKDARFPVRVLNEFKSPIKLRRGTVLGQCREVEAIVHCEKLPESDSIGENDIAEDKIMDGSTRLRNFSSDTPTYSTIALILAMQGQSIKLLGVFHLPNVQLYAK